jgi:hypothetical protein
MPFNVRLADREEPLIYSETKPHEANPFDGAIQLYRGILFGGALLAVFLVAFAIGAHVASFPNWHSFMTFWLSWR